MNWEKKITIYSPMKKIVEWKPKKKKEEVTYLTANLFTSDRIHFAVKRKIYDKCKTYLLEHLTDIPKLQSIEMDITYYDNGQQWDVDNRDFFWRKLIMDILKTPTEKQEERAMGYGREIITLRVLPDDNVKYYKGGKHYYGGRGDMMVIEMRGELQMEQQGLF